MARNHIGSRRGHRQCAVLHSFLGGEHVRRRLHVVLDVQDEASSQHQWPELPSTAGPGVELRGIELRCTQGRAQACSLAISLDHPSLDQLLIWAEETMTQT